MIDPHDMADVAALGPRQCCVCDQMKNPCRTIAMLDIKGPRPGQGWGCVQCHLPFDGAEAVICDDCVEKDFKDIRFVCDGYIDNPGRIPIDELTTPHKHDDRFHPEMMEEGQEEEL